MRLSVVFSSAIVCCLALSAAELRAQEAPEETSPEEAAETAPEDDISTEPPGAAGGIFARPSYGLYGRVYAGGGYGRQVISGYGLRGGSLNFGAHGGIRGPHWGVEIGLNLFTLLSPEFFGPSGESVDAANYTLFAGSFAAGPVWWITKNTYLTGQIGAGSIQISNDLEDEPTCEENSAYCEDVAFVSTIRLGQEFNMGALRGSTPTDQYIGVAAEAHWVRVPHQAAEEEDMVTAALVISYTWN